MRGSSHISCCSNLLVAVRIHKSDAVAVQVKPEAAAVAIGESKALCEAVLPFIDQLNDQEKLLEDTSQLQVADRAVRTGNAGVV